jgi:hypothetical protein
VVLPAALVDCAAAMEGRGYCLGRAALLPWAVGAAARGGRRCYKRQPVPLRMMVVLLAVDVHARR